MLSVGGMWTAPQGTAGETEGRHDGKPYSGKTSRDSPTDDVRNSYHRRILASRHCAF
jgi:hypothetical protein